MDKPRSFVKLQPCSDSVDLLNAKSNKLREYAESVTVPILSTQIFVESGTRREIEFLVGTGVLFQFEDHFFVLTAGHCVPCCKRPFYKDTHFGKRNKPTIIREEYIDKKDCVSRRDWGYLEIERSSLHNSFEQKRFLSKDELVVLTPSQFQSLPKPAMVAGFPGEIAEKEESSITPRFLKIIGPMEGCEIEFPTCPDLKGTGASILISNGVEESENKLIEKCRLAEHGFECISGGGVWAPVSKDFDVSLIGIAVGSPPRDKETWEILCAVPVGFILRLIAHPDFGVKGLKEPILNQWKIVGKHEEWHDELEF